MVPRFLTENLLCESIHNKQGWLSIKIFVSYWSFNCVFNIPKILFSKSFLLFYNYFLSIYSSTLNDIVGPFGVVINLKLTDSFVFENVSKWVTFNGPAIVKKSFITFPFRTLKFDALKWFLKVSNEHQELPKGSPRS